MTQINDTTPISQSPNLPILKSLNLHPSALVAITGGGGKTALLFALAEAWPGRVIITTTTRIFAAQMKLAPAVVQFTAEDAESAERFEREMGKKLDEYGRILIVGPVVGEKAHGVPPDLPAKLLTRKDVDLVLIEADGSRMRPIKAPAAHEPVIPPKTTHVIPVVGIDALDKPLAEVAHRPELVAERLGYQVSGIRHHQLSPKDVARLIVHAEGGM
ncbi:MAG: putative selenium-dependent hydroxylase accessory protein YqeC, partial [Chloroflexi bacterium]